MKQSTFDAGRVSALSDGVFAIAMTLLVLELKLPDLAPKLSRKGRLPNRNFEGHLGGL